MKRSSVKKSENIAARVPYGSKLGSVTPSAAFNITGGEVKVFTATATTALGTVAVGTLEQIAKQR